MLFIAKRLLLSSSFSILIWGSDPSMHALLSIYSLPKEKNILCFFFSAATPLKKLLDDEENQLKSVFPHVKSYQNLM